MSAAARLVVKELLRKDAPQMARSFKTSAAPKYHYDYEHGPNYLNFQDMPNRKRKIATWVLGMWAAGVGIPLFAVWYQQQKLRA